MGTELIRRIVLGGVAIAAVVVAVILLQWSWWPPFFAALVAIVAAAAQWEYYHLARIKGMRPAVWMGIGAGIFFLAVHWFQSVGCLAPGVSALGLGLAGFAVACFFLGRSKEGIAGLATSIFGIVYVVVPFGLFYDLLFYYPSHYHTTGWWWFFYAVGVTTITDMGAYFVGKFFGRHKMVPVISPGKTWEGTIGGIIVGVAFAIIWWLFGRQEMEFWMAAALGAVVAIVGQVADLVESLFKRDAEVKDSNVIPSLGGVLDIVDSLLFTLPAVYIFMRMTIGG